MFIQINFPNFADRSLLFVASLTLAWAIALWTGSTASAKETVVVQNGGLYVLEGKKATEIFSESVNGFGVSPDGEHVVFSPIFGKYGGSVIIEDLGTKKSEVISEESGLGWSHVRYASSGSQIVGRAYSEATGTFGIYAMDTNGANVRRLVSEGAWPVMSSQGALAYLSNDAAADLYIVDPSPSGYSGPRKLASGGFYGANAGRISFSPDGKSILFPRIGTNTHAISISTGEPKFLTGVTERAEWESANTVLDATGGVLRRDLNAFKTTVVTEAGASWVRSNQPAGEAKPPEAFEPPDDCESSAVGTVVNEAIWVSLHCDGPELSYKLDTEPSHEKYWNLHRNTGNFFISLKPTT